MIKLYNTLTKTLDTFTANSSEPIKLYTCGPTVYDFLHVGNWAAYIYWDTLVRMLQANNFTVDRVMNITDVGHLTGENTGDADTGEDKLEKGARREGKTAWQIAQFYTDDFMHGMQQLNLLPPTHMVRATDYIPEQIDLVRVLKNKGFTYQIDDGIYFDTSKFPSYATFANLNLANQKAGARVTFNAQKRNSSDFALWKFTQPNETRDMQWETPNDLLDTPNSEPRMGFPGWHIECSAIAMGYLGETFDIHTGGIDHIPVHHTNEIAQSEAATGKQFSRFWLHNNHIKSNGTKISKSLGNGYTLADLAKKGFSALDYRMFVLQGQFTNEGNFTFENLAAARNRLHHWRNIAALRHQTHDTIIEDTDKPVSANEFTPTLLALPGAIREAVSDNLNTPHALQLIDRAFTIIGKKPLDTVYRHGLIDTLAAIDEILGLQLIETTPDISDEQKQLILKRRYARDQKDWKKSDEIRDTLLAEGIELRDMPNNTIWEYAK